MLNGQAAQIGSAFFHVIDQCPGAWPHKYPTTAKIQEKEGSCTADGNKIKVFIGIYHNLHEWILANKLNLHSC